MWFSRDYEEDKKPKGEETKTSSVGPEPEEDIYEEKTFNLRFKFVDSDNLGIETVKASSPARRNSLLQRLLRSNSSNEKPEAEDEEMPNFNSSVVVTLHQAPSTVPDIILCAQENQNYKELTILRCSHLPQFSLEIFKDVMQILKTKGSHSEYVKNSSGEGTLQIFLIGVIFQVNLI
jgi:hypothetical protein